MERIVDCMASLRWIVHLSMGDLDLTEEDWAAFYGGLDFFFCGRVYSHVGLRVERTNVYL